MDQSAEKECTVRCRSMSHAKQILRVAVNASSDQIRSYSVWLCHNFPVITDELGRNLLHVASSCGKWDIVKWLLEHCNVDVDVKDSESGWTALHRSLFYGQLFSARILSLYGASIRSVDREGFTPFDILLKDRLPYVEYSSSDPSEVYAWGSNVNCNLGLGRVQSRDAPEILEVFHKDFTSIKQVEICKFHSVFLSSDGRVYTCGYGHGGRLGQGNEDTCLVPSLVKGIGSLQCLQAAAGQDHLLLLLEGGQVWSCGLNMYHQLGQIPPTERVLVPKAISLKFLKGKEVVGIKAARFHSVIYTRNCLYTFGLNAGQLGHPKGDRTQINPRPVSALMNEQQWHITHVETSDGAIVCATSHGDVYVLHEYKTRRIASKQLDVRKLSVVGGHLDSRCDVAGVREGGGLELRIMLLTKAGKVYLWRQTDPYFRRCLFKDHKLKRELIMSDIHINHSTIGFITKENEGFLGTIVPFKGQRSAPPATTLHSPSIHSTSPGLILLLDTDDCSFIRIKKIPLVYRGTSITSDSKGRNFAVLQSIPKMGLIEVPRESESRIKNDFARFLSETCIGDEFHDIMIEVGKRKFAAHKFILSSRSDYFKKHLTLNHNADKDAFILEHIESEVFEQVLKYIYSNHCDFLTPNYEVNWEPKQNGKKKKSGPKVTKDLNPVVILQEASKRLGINTLAKRLNTVKVVNGKIVISDITASPKLFFNRNSMLSLADVNLISSDGDIFRCHKCILVARLDYFHSMLNASWSECTHLENLPLPISSKVMEVLLDYIYSDKANKVSISEDPEFLCHVLMTADQLLIERLKELCEKALVELLTLKNAAELLELSYMYKASQLKQSCMQFISLNLATILETKSLDILSDEVMLELSSYYKTLVPSMYKRRISCFGGPSQEELDFIEKTFPVNSTCPFEKKFGESYGKKGSRRTSSIRSDKDVAISRKKSNSESSDKDIVIDVIMPNFEELKIEEDSYEFKIKSDVPKTIVQPTSSEPKVRILMPLLSHFPTLDKVMSEEKQRLNPLPKKSDMKPIPVLSQKQRKKLENRKDNSLEILIPSSPPDKTVCPWYKLPEKSLPSPSFWDAYDKKEFQPSSISSNEETPTKKTSENSVNQFLIQNSNNDALSSNNDVMISLTAIQKDEELRQRKAFNPKIKPLDLINVEDQAIEELIVLYKAEGNFKEKITVSRVTQESTSPIWKLHRK